MLLIINDIFNQGFKLNELLSGLNHHILNLLTSKLENYKQILNLPEETKSRYFENSKKWEYVDLLTISDKITRMEIDFKIVNNPKIFIELNLLKIIDSSNKIVFSNNTTEINNDNENISSKVESIKKSKIIDNKKSSVLDSNDNFTKSIKKIEKNIKKDQITVDNIDVDQKNINHDNINIDKIIEIWPKVNLDIEIESKSIAAFLLHSKPHTFDNDLLRISLPKKYQFQIDVLNNNKDKILSVIQKYIDKFFKIEFFLDDSKALDQNEINPITKKIIEKFDADIN